MFTGKFGGAFRTLVIIGVCVVVGALLAGAAHPPQDRIIHVVARKYAYDPPIIHLNQGDRVTLTLKSLDVTHGFYLDGYDLDASIAPDEKPQLRHPSRHDPFVEVSEIHFVANRAGKFRYRCSQTCGSMHPFMIGEMVVAPNRPFTAGVGGAIGVTLAVLLTALGKTAPKTDRQR
jgi:heme/copper-type cytochrome/quinol oxidase subunit 2